MKSVNERIEKMNALPHLSFVKCDCRNCGGRIEFDPESFMPGMETECPHCGAMTALELPQVKTAILTMKDIKAREDASVKKMVREKFFGYGFSRAVGLGLFVLGCACGLDGLMSEVRAETVLQQTPALIEMGVGVAGVGLGILIYLAVEIAEHVKNKK